MPVGGRTTLVWETRRAATCALDEGSGPVAVSPSARASVIVNRDTRFVLACENAQGWNASTAEVRVTTAARAPTIESFEIDRGAIARGDIVFASWQAAEATRCRLRDDQQATTWRLPPEGQMKLAPAASTNYTLTCRNAYGFDQTGISVSVAENDEPLRVLSFELTGAEHRSSDNLQMAKPGLVRVSWTTESARACRISDDAGRAASVPLNGTRIIRIGETTAVQINCVSRGAEAQSLAQAQVLREALFFDDFEG